MKKINLFLLMIVLCYPALLEAQNSDKITRVLEYKPAPGQHINRLFPTPAMSDTYNNALAFASARLVNNAGMLGLGGYGGYVVVGFDHSIVNVQDEFDFKVLGNAFTNSAEPGIVMVCQDINKNGKPDPQEPWYELAGSDYYKATTIRNYAITYHRPNPDGQKSNIRWTDNQGNEGHITHISFATQATMFPLWVSENTMTFRGTRLAGNATQSGSTWLLPALAWGYVDNHANNAAISNNGFKIDWAVDDSGNPVHLEYIDFIKVYTGMVQEAGWLGETSTEIAGIIDLHPNAVLPTFPPVGNDYITLDLQNTTTLAANPLQPNSRWADTYTENAYLESQKFIFSHRTGWGGTYWDGFTMSNYADNNDYGYDWVPNQWGSMTQGGVNGLGSNFLIGYWGSYNDTGATNVTQTSNYISFTDAKPHKAIGTYVTNAPWSYYGIKNGDQFARRFVQGDYFKLIAKGFAADGVTETGTAEFYLADYRSVNPAQWKLHNTWQWFDLTSLGVVSYIQFTMESTDAGAWGINTATLFCMDKLTVQSIDDVRTVTEATQTSHAYRSGKTLYALPVGAQVSVFTLCGNVYHQQKATGSTMELPDNGLYIIRIEYDGNTQILK